MPFRIACLVATACLVLPATRGPTAAGAPRALPALAPANGAAPGDACPGASEAPTAATTQQAARAVACLVDRERAKRGLEPLQRDGDLDLAARRHSRDMARHDVFSHTGTDGSGLADRARAAGFPLTGRWSLGETLGWGTGTISTPETLVEEWLDSPAHRRILLDAGFSRLGAGVAAGAPEPSTDDLPSATYTVDLAG